MGTKMSYLRDKKIKREKILKLAGGVFLLLILFYFRAGLWRGLSFAAQGLFRPILLVGNRAGAGLGNLGAYFSSKKSLYYQNENLKREIVSRDAKMANYNALALENESLKNILLRVPAERKLVLSVVLAKPNQSPYDTLLIDLGGQAGVAAGARVFAAGDIPIGRVQSVSSDMATVILFSTAKEKTPVIIPVSLAQRDSSDIFWELVGRGGGNFEMTLPRDFILAKGDPAILPGLTPYTVAITETILSDPRDPFKKALLRSPVNIQALKFVEVELQ